MASYLVTGGAGFIGSHLCDELLGAGHRVLVLDDFSTGQRRNLAHLEQQPRFRCVAGSVTDRSLLAECVEATDAVFHLAAVVGMRLVTASPLRTLQTNLRGSELVLELASQHRRRVLFASSSEVYGRSQRLPFREEDELILPGSPLGRWAYACSKAAGERLALAYAAEQDLKVSVVRLFNTAGPRQCHRYGMVIPTLVQQALAGRPITLHGDGSQRRCFCDVRDAVAGLIRLMEHPRAAGRVFNLGSDREISIAELAERVRVLTGSHSPIVRLRHEEVFGEPFEDVQRRVPDLTRVRALIDFEPRTDVDEIIARSVEHESALSTRSPLVPSPPPADPPAAG
jgi:UDP-glucose 4-epimerase